MGQVTISINNRTYKVGCEDGQEDRLFQLSKILQEKAHDLTRQLGMVADTQLLIMTALLVADEVSDLRVENERLQRLVKEGQELIVPRDADAAEIEAEVAEALDRASARLEALAGQMAGNQPRG